MVKAKAPRPTKSAIDADRVARLRAAEQFQSGDRVLHLLTNKQGTFREVCVGFAVTEVWVDFDTKTETGFVTEPCNPLEIIKLETEQFNSRLVESVNCVEEQEPDSTDLSAVEVQEGFNQLEIEGLQQPECLLYSTLSPELGAFPSQPETLVGLSQHDSSKSILSAHRSSPTTFQELKSIVTSETSIPLEQPGTLSPPDSPVPTSQPPMSMDEVYQAIAPDFGGNCSGSLPTQGLDSSASKTSPICAIEDLRTLSTALPKSGTWDLTSLWEQPTLERPILGKGYSLLPTPMSYSPGSSLRRPGQTKLDLRLRLLPIPTIWGSGGKEKRKSKNGQILKTALEPHLKEYEVLNPAVPLWMMGFPTGWLDCTTQAGGQQTQLHKIVESPEEVVLGDTTNSEPPETPSVPELPRSLSEESFTSTNSHREIMEQEFPDASLPPTIGQPELPLSPCSDMDNFTTATADAGCVDTAVAPDFGLPTPDENNLSPDEEADRQRLETRVERAFYESGTALRELRNRRLYRDNYETFEEYVKKRFGMQRSHAYHLIDAVGVAENLCTISTHEDCVEPLTRYEVFPTSEYQVRSLVPLSPEQQREVWQQAVEEAGGKVPSGRIVKNIAERRKCKDTPLPETPYAQGDVVMIRGAGHPGLRKHDGRWAIALQINEYSITISLPNGKDIPVKPQFLEPVDPKYWADIKAVHERIEKLQQCELDSLEDMVLEGLYRRTCFNEKQIALLQFLEMRYNIS